MDPSASPGLDRWPERRIVLIGKTGVGKSASGNTILNEEKFHSKFSLISVTQQTMTHQAVIDGRLVSVVDTPGLFDTNLTQEELDVKLGRDIFESSPGLHAFLIVLNIKHTEQEEQVIQMIRRFYGEEILKYTIILFTHGDEFERDNIEKLIKENKALSDLVQMCGQRYQVFNNKDRKNRHQVMELLEKIDSMLEENQGVYTHDMYRDAKRLREEEEERQKKSKQEEIDKIKKETEERVWKDAKKEMMKLKQEHEEEMERLRRESNKGESGSEPLQSGNSILSKIQRIFRNPFS